MKRLNTLFIVLAMLIYLIPTIAIAQDKTLTMATTTSTDNTGLTR